jgi:hypothetical protein
MEEDIKKFKTCELVEELKRREAVQHLFTKPYEKIEILVGGKKQDLQINEGPVNILIVWD